MKNTLTVLGGVLLVQMGLVAIAWIDRTPAPVAAHSLADIDAQALTAIHIWDANRSGKESEPLVLRKDGSTWGLASSDGYPVSPVAIDGLLALLAGVSVRAPVSTSADSHTKLRVSPDQYTRRLALKVGESSTDLFIGVAGTAAAMMRLGGSDDVYRVPGFSPWEIKTVESSWYEPQYLLSDTSTWASLDIAGPLADVSLTRDERGLWTSPDLVEGESLDQVRVNLLLSSLSKIDVAALPVSQEVDAGFSESTVVSWTTETRDDIATHSFQIGALFRDNYYVKADGMSHMVLVKAMNLDPAMLATLDRLKLDQLDDFDY